MKGLVVWGVALVVLLSRLDCGGSVIPKPTLEQLPAYLLWVATAGPISRTCFDGTELSLFTNDEIVFAFARWNGGSLFHGTRDHSQFAAANIRKGSFYSTAKLYAKTHVQGYGYFASGTMSADGFVPYDTFKTWDTYKPAVAEYVTAQGAANSRFLVTGALMMQRLVGALHGSSTACQKALTHEQAQLQKHYRQVGGQPSQNVLAAKMLMAAAAVCFPFVGPSLKLEGVIQNRQMANEDLEIQMKAVVMRSLEASREETSSKVSSSSVSTTSSKEDEDEPVDDEPQLSTMVVVPSKLEDFFDEGRPTSGPNMGRVFAYEEVILFDAPSGASTATWDTTNITPLDTLPKDPATHPFIASGLEFMTSCKATRSGPIPPLYSIDYMTYTGSWGTDYPAIARAVLLPTSKKYQWNRDLLDLLDGYIKDAFAAKFDRYRRSHRRHHPLRTFLADLVVLVEASARQSLRARTLYQLRRAAWFVLRYLCKLLSTRKVQTTVCDMFVSVLKGGSSSSSVNLATLQGVVGSRQQILGTRGVI